MSTDHFVYDVLGLGVPAIDNILYVETYPPADVKVRVIRRERHLGGLTTTALVTTARLGAKTAYAGMLGYDDLSEWAIQGLRNEGIDLTHLVRRQEARPIASTIVVATKEKTRNIFFDLNGVLGPDTQLPEADVIRSARVLLVDYIGTEGMLRAAQIAHDSQIPIIADFEFNRDPRFPELLALVDHFIISQHFASQLSGEQDPVRAAKKLWTDQRTVVCITCGVDGAWYITGQDTPPQHQPAFLVDTVDSTGCGDVFHGAYAATLVRGFELPERMRFAAAAAAIKATQPGGQTGIPTWDKVEAFLRTRG